MKQLFYLLAVVLSLSSHAATKIQGTRFIFPSDKHEISVRVDNVGSTPVLLQSWIDDGQPNKKPDAMNIPFIVIPPLVRVDGGQGQFVRIIYTGTDSILPKNKESIFWLNILEVPPNLNSAANQLKLAFRSRMKMIWRPKSLNEINRDIANDLKWKKIGNDLELNNTSPFYISISNIRITDGKYVQDIAGDLLKPLDKHLFKIKSGVSKVTITYLTDYGARKTVDLN